MSEERSQRNPVERLADEFVSRYRLGERPSLTEYCEKHPELASEIRELFPALVIMEQLAPRERENAEAVSDSEEAARRTLERHGEYRILREIGRGGMGVVYEAEQESLGRHVALKVLPLHALLNPTHLERFRREARAAARLHHTNIVPVFSVGEHNGIHFYAMQFIQGQGLDEVLEEVKRLRAGRGSPGGSPERASGTPPLPPDAHSQSAGTPPAPVVQTLAAGLVSGELAMRGSRSASNAGAVVQDSSRIGGDRETVPTQPIVATSASSAASQDL
jgi:hypothetical protein